MQLQVCVTQLVGKAGEAEREKARAGAAAAEREPGVPRRDVAGRLDSLSATRPERREIRPSSLVIHSVRAPRRRPPLSGRQQCSKMEPVGEEEAILPHELEPEPEQPTAAQTEAERESERHRESGLSTRYVRLNVGGTRYTTLLDTLTRVPGSMLAAMFDGLDSDDADSARFALPQDDTGAFIIDRDGPSFRHVLNFLRHEGAGPCPLPRSAEDRSVLALEAQYYMLDELLDQCCSIGHNGRQLYAAPDTCPLVTHFLLTRPMRRLGRRYPMSQAEFLSQPLRDGSANGAPVKIVCLPPVDLRAVNMAYQSYIGCAFRECDFRQVDMRKAELSYCDLRDARLQGSDLSDATLR